MSLFWSLAPVGVWSRELLVNFAYATCSGFERANRAVLFAANRVGTVGHRA